MQTSDVVNLENKISNSLSSVTALELGESIISLITGLKRKVDAKEDEIKSLIGEMKDMVEDKNELEKEVRCCKQRILELNNEKLNKHGKTINLHALQQLVKGK